MSGMDVAKYCTICGQGLVATAVVCVKCGSPVTPHAETTVFTVPKAKKKATALVLAIFLGYWTWLYTIRTDRIRFLIGLAATIVILVFAATQQNINDRTTAVVLDCYTNAILGLPHPNCDLLPKPDDTLFIANRVIAAGVYIWAIIVTARRPKEFFTSYSMRA